MEENVSPELSLAPEPEQSQDPMDSSSQVNTEKDKEQKEEDQEGDDVPEAQLEGTEKSAKATSEFRKTWGFRRTTIAKREMPGEAPAESQEGRGPVRRSGRQAKRTDKLEEFLLTTKRGGRKSGLASLEGGDPPSQTPTDAETASEASFDGNTDGKSVDDKPESPERMTRSGSRMKTAGKAKGGRGCRAGVSSVKDDGSSENENEEDGDVGGGGGDASKTPQSDNRDQPTDRDLNVEKETEKPSPAETEEGDAAQPQQNQESVKNNVEGEEEKSEEKNENEEKEVVAKEEEVGESKETAVTNVKRISNRSPAKAASLSSTPIKRDTKAKPGPKSRKVQEEEDDSEESSSSSTTTSSSSDPDDGGGYDPNALYCICRQKHNKRFMICCDRCEEWFHGDCVGITEARGRLMERNGEDYVCPNCSAKKSQAIKAAVPAMATENGKPKTVVAAAFPETRKAESSLSLSPAVSAPSAGTEEKGSDDLGIKGRIEKATNPSGKKKIKIFQPAAVQSPAAAAQTALPTEGKEGEGSDLPKCIGPGCEKNAQPDSVYCGNDCILRHAAAAMKSITDVKEPKQKDKDKPKAQRKKPGTRSTPKKSSATGKKTSKKSTEEEESDSDDDDDDDDEDERAEDHPPPPATSSWSSDHNYNAVTPEKTTPLSPTVLNKTCMYLLEGLDNPSLTITYLFTL